MSEYDRLKKQKDEILAKQRSAVEIERDQLREELKSCDKYAKEQYKAYDEQLAIAHKHILDMQVTNGSLTTTVDRLKEDLKTADGLVAHWILTSDHWKSVAGTMAEALEKIKREPTDECGKCNLDGSIAKAALALFSASRGDEGEKSK